MANLQGNPWAIFPADVKVATTTAITQNADGTVSVTTAASHGIQAPVAISAASEAGNIVTISTTLNPPVGSLVAVVNVTPVAYNGLWTVLTSSGANFTYFNPTPSIGAGTAFGTAIPQNQYVTLVNPSVLAYQGFYFVLVVPSATTLTLVPQFPILQGLGAGTTGTVALNLYPNQTRIEDISWQNPSAAGQILDLRDRDGNPLWQATSTGSGSLNRGKVFWVEGITPVVLQSGVVLATIN